MRMLNKVCILLIGMISFTAMSSTPLQDRKQKATTELCLLQSGLVEVLHVDVMSTMIFCETQSIAQTLFVKIYKPNNFAVPVDVGWKTCSKNKYTRIHYQEKLLENYNLHFRNKTLIDIGQIRYDC